MAEFAEVMRQAERMCKAHERCVTCPLYDYCDQFNDTRGGQWRVDAGAMEQAVMDWAEENPEPPEGGE